MSLLDSRETWRRSPVILRLATAGLDSAANHATPPHGLDWGDAAATLPLAPTVPAALRVFTPAEADPEENPPRTILPFARRDGGTPPEPCPVELALLNSRGQRIPLAVHRSQEAVVEADPVPGRTLRARLFAPAWRIGRSNLRIFPNRAGA